MTFGATDAPLEAKDLDKDGLAQWPMVMGGIVMVVNIPGVKPGELVLDGPTVAQIYMGKITKWNDPAIKKLNPNLNLPDLAIAQHPSRRRLGHHLQLHLLPVRRSRPSGNRGIGKATTVEWPSGIGAKGNDGVANNVATTPGAIGYVEFAYAEQNKLTFTSMVNKAGKTVAPTMDAFQAAAANADWSVPGFYQILANQPGDAVVADDRRDLHPDVQEAGQCRRVERRARSSSSGLTRRATRWRRISTTSRCLTTSSSWSRRCGTRTSSRNDGPAGGGGDSAAPPLRGKA